MISIHISLKKDELFINPLLLTFSLSTLTVFFFYHIIISYALLPVIYFFLLIAHTTIPMIISSIGTAIIMIRPVITACSVFIVILLKV